MANPAFQRIEKLFHEAIALPPDARMAFLDEACAGDAELHAAVEDLLRHATCDDQTLAGPLASVAAHIRSGAPTVKRETVPTSGGTVSSPEIPGYDVLEELGRGGMGVVYKVRQRSLNRIVALKMLLPTQPDDSETLARFRIEVETLARLHHPNIIVIYDIGVEAGRPYFTMEYIDGPSLASLLGGRPQDPVDAARLMETLARTMHAVHQHGIIHRDLKPANVLLKRDAGARMDAKASTDTASSLPLAFYVAKITDFGLAKDQAGGGKLTATGATMGTPCYMAPEQARALPGVGPAADIYALGSILYELLTGRPPFEGQAAVDVINQLLNDEPISPLNVRPRLPTDLVTICLKCLEKAPSKRYASALDLAEDLRRFEAGQPIHARPVGALERMTRWCRRRPLVAALGAVCVLLLATLIVTVLAYDFRLRAALAAQVEAQRQQIVLLNVQIGISEIDHGNGFMAVLRFTEALRLDEGLPDRERAHRVRIAEALQHCPRLLQLRVQDRQVLCTHFTAKGGWVATVGKDHTAEVADVMTGRPVGPNLKLDEIPRNATISPDGRLLAAIDNDMTRVWDLTTGKSKDLPCRGSQRIRNVAFHPEGRILITQHADSSVRLWDLTAEQSAVPPPLSAGAFVHGVLSKDARWLFTVDAQRMGQVWNLATGKTAANPLAVRQDLLLAAISSDGRRVAVVGVDGTLNVWDLADGRLVGKAMPMQTRLDHLAFSPDAEQLLALTSNKNLMAWQLHPDERPSLSREPWRNVAHGHWDADGRHIVTINESGAAQIMHLASGRHLTPPLAHGGRLHSVALQGRKIIAVTKGGTVSLWELPEGAAQTQGAAPAPPDLRPLAELRLFAQVLAGGRIGEQQQWEAFEPEQLRIAWEGWQKLSE